MQGGETISFTVGVMDDLAGVELRIELYAKAVGQAQHVVVVWIGDPAGAQIEDGALNAHRFGAAADAVFRLDKSNREALRGKPIGCGKAAEAGADDGDVRVYGVAARRVALIGLRFL